MALKQFYFITLLVLYGLLTIGTFIQTCLPALMPTLTDVFPDMTEGRIGYIIGTQILTAAAAGVVMGYYGDKIRRMQVAFIGSCITTVFTLASGIIRTYLELFICQIGVSIGLGATLPIMAGILADLYPSTKRGRAFAALSIVTTVLGELGGTLIALILSAAGNWRWTYFGLGIVSAAITPLLFFTLEPQRGRQEEALSQIYQEDPTLTYTFKIRREDLKYIWQRRSNLFLVLNFVDNMPGAVFSTYAIAWLMNEHHANEDGAFLALIIVVLGIFIGTITFGTIGDKRFSRDRRIKVKLGTFLSIFSAPFLIVAVNLKWTLESNQSIFESPLAMITIGCMALGLLIDGGIYPNWLSAITDVNLPEHRSTMISLANFFDACGRSLGAFLGGFLIDRFGYPTAMTVTSLFILLSFVWWVPSLKTFVPDYFSVQKILEDHANAFKAQLSKE